MNEEKNKIQEYIDKVCRLIKNKDVHEDVKLELQDHMEIIKEEYLNTGLTEEEALEKAIAHMGDFELVGKQLDITHKRQVEWTIVIPMLLLSLLGLVAIYFIQALGIDSNQDTAIFQKSIVYYAIGSVLAICIYAYDYRRILPYSKHIFIGTLLMLIASIAYGTKANGSSFLSLGIIKVNFFSISPILLTISLAGILCKWDWNWKNTKSFLLSLVVIFVPLLILHLGSLIYLFIYFTDLVILMYASGAKPYQLAVVMGAFCSPLLLKLINEPYVKARLFSFLNPNTSASEKGWIFNQIKNAIDSAGLLGKGFSMKPHSIPEVHTDYIFAYITYAIGWVAAALLIALMILFIFRLLKVAKSSKDSYGKLMVKGFAAIFSAQFLLGLLINFGLCPLNAVSLPFLSYSGSQMVVNLCSIGLILSIYRRRNLTPKVVKI